MACRPIALIASFWISELAAANLENTVSNWGSLGAWANSSFGDPLGVYTQMTCDYEVPATPRKYSQQSVFVWCAVEPARSDRYDMGVLQPEIDYGPNCMPSVRPQDGIGPGVDPAYDSQPYWYWSAQYVHPNVSKPVSHADGPKYGYICHTGQLFKARPGQRLITNMTYDPTTDAWLNYIYSPDTGESSFFNATNPYMQTSLSWRDFMHTDGVKAMFFIETYNVQDWRVEMPPVTTWSSYYSLQRRGGAVSASSVGWSFKDGKPENLHFDVARDGRGQIIADFHGPNERLAGRQDTNSVVV